MNRLRSSDTATTMNTLLNSCDRWDRSDRDVLSLKVPRRRPSNSFIGCNDNIMPIDALRCTFMKDENLEISKDGPQNLCVDAADDSAAFSFDGWASGAWLYVPQSPVPENKHLRRRISFSDSVERRDYSVTIGDNPSCHGPCALTLDWSHSESRMVSYNDCQENNGGGDDDTCCLTSARPAKYLSTDERRERVLEFMSASQEELRQLELEMRPADVPRDSDRTIRPTRRQAVWQNGHVRRPSYDVPPMEWT